jgi:hypothetical protein
MPFFRESDLSIDADHDVVAILADVAIACINKSNHPDDFRELFDESVKSMRRALDVLTADQFPKPPSTMVLPPALLPPAPTACPIRSW